MASTTFTLTTICLNNGNVETVTTELHRLDVKSNVDLITVFSVLMSERFGEIIVYGPSDELKIEGDILREDCDGVCIHILEKH